jgi:hypothetical protein
MFNQQTDVSLFSIAFSHDFRSQNVRSKMIVKQTANTLQKSTSNQPTTFTSIQGLKIIKPGGLPKSSQQVSSNVHKPTNTLDKFVTKLPSSDVKKATPSSSTATANHAVKIAKSSGSTSSFLSKGEASKKHAGAVKSASIASSSSSTTTAKPATHSSTSATGGLKIPTIPNKLHKPGLSAKSPPPSPKKSLVPSSHSTNPNASTSSSNNTTASHPKPAPTLTASSATKQASLSSSASLKATTATNPSANLASSHKPTTATTATTATTSSTKSSSASVSNNPSAATHERTKGALPLEKSNLKSVIPTMTTSKPLNSSDAKMSQSKVSSSNSSAKASKPNAPITSPEKPQHKPPTNPSISNGKIALPTTETTSTKSTTPKTALSALPKPLPPSTKSNDIGAKNPRGGSDGASPNSSPVKQRSPKPKTASKAIVSDNRPILTKKPSFVSVRGFIVVVVFFFRTLLFSCSHFLCVGC